MALKILTGKPSEDGFSAEIHQLRLDPTDAGRGPQGFHDVRHQADLGRAVAERLTDKGVADQPLVVFRDEKAITDHALRCDGRVSAERAGVNKTQDQRSGVRIIPLEAVLPELLLLREQRFQIPGTKLAQVEDFHGKAESCGHYSKTRASSQ